MFVKLGPFSRHLRVLQRLYPDFFSNYEYVTFWGIFKRAPAISSPPLSETTGPILKIQTAFERPGNTVGKHLGVTSSQVRSKSKFDHFGLGDIGEQNCDVAN